MHVHDCTTMILKKVIVAISMWLLTDHKTLVIMMVMKIPVMVRLTKNYIDKKNTAQMFIQAKKGGHKNKQGCPSGRNQCT